jgi:hypothetical protein
MLIKKPNSAYKKSDVFKAAIAIKTLEKYDHQQASEQAKHC